MGDGSRGCSEREALRRLTSRFRPRLGRQGARADEPHRIVREGVESEHSQRSEELLGPNRDVDELAVRGFRLGVVGVTLLLFGTALTLAAVWV